MVTIPTKVDNKWFWVYNRVLFSQKELSMNLSAAVSRDMQRTRQINMYGMTEQDIREQYMESITAKCSGLEMVVMGILSDCQEMLSINNTSIPSPRSTEYTRKQMNVAKFILAEMIDSKVSKI